MCLYEADTVIAWQPPTHDSYPLRNTDLQRDEQNFTKYLQAWNCWKTRQFFSSTHMVALLQKGTKRGWQATKKGDITVHCKKRALFKLRSRVENNTRRWWAVKGSCQAVFSDEKLTNLGKGHPTLCPVLKKWLRNIAWGGGGIITADVHIALHPYGPCMRAALPTNVTAKFKAEMWPVSRFLVSPTKLFDGDYSAHLLRFHPPFPFLQSRQVRKQRVVREDAARSDDLLWQWYGGGRISMSSTQTRK